MGNSLYTRRFSFSWTRGLGIFHGNVISSRVVSRDRYGIRQCQPRINMKYGEQMTERVPYLGLVLIEKRFRDVEYKDYYPMGFVLRTLIHRV